MAEKTYVVLLHTAAAPDEAEWQAYVDAVRAIVLASATEVHVFIATDGGGPDAGRAGTSPPSWRGDPTTP
jgi:hypothetical protein